MDGVSETESEDDDDDQTATPTPSSHGTIAFITASHVGANASSAVAGAVLRQARRRISSGDSFKGDAKSSQERDPRVREAATQRHDPNSRLSLQKSSVEALPVYGTASGRIHEGCGSIPADDGYRGSEGRRKENNAGIDRTPSQLSDLDTEITSKRNSQVRK